uniref:uncharacterized protein LOC101310045 n=1 Tax=Fragaria vesca subsp. vesca TaxID=101020 RepID=UPI0005CAE95B|nr:PREDICTED: uncharacterized protein LOC101310045 [Fragaria vesca subsp. vesca]
MEELHHSIMDTLLFEIADQMNDGGALAVLHLTLEILEAEQIFGSVGILMADMSVPEPTVAVAVEVTEETEEETNDDYGQGDYADAGDYFDCFEGAGIAIHEGFVQLKRSS